MFAINNRDNTPLFEQIIQEVAKFIALGVLQPHDQLPTVRMLAKDLGINPNTVAKAYHECEMNGLIYSIPGKGSFVAEQDDGLNSLISDALEQLTVIVNQLKNLGVPTEEIFKSIKEVYHD